jgi:biotin carboxyl carrier protein
MANNYHLKVNEKYQFTSTAAVVKELDVISKGQNQFQQIEKDQNFDIEIIKEDFKSKKYQIKVNGNKYTVAISDELDLLIKELGLTLNDQKKEKDIKAPMPGLILDILVKEGQEVKEGDPLLVLEAMKMENMLLAPADAVVKTIHVNKTDPVEKKQLLIEMS